MPTPFKWCVKYRHQPAPNHSVSQATWFEDEDKARAQLAKVLATPEWTLDFFGLRQMDADLARKIEEVRAAHTLANAAIEKAKAT